MNYGQKILKIIFLIFISKNIILLFLFEFYFWNLALKNNFSKIL